MTHVAPEAPGPAAPVPLAGWYPDGATPGVVRWFDGTGWTQHVHPVPQPVPAPLVSPRPNPYGSPAEPSRFDWPASSAGDVPASRTAYAAPSTATAYGPPLSPYGPATFPAPDHGPSSAVHWLVPVGRSWQAIAAGYLGIFALFLPVVAPFAIWAGVVALRRARHGGHGRGRAVFGIVAGGIGLAWGSLALLGTLL